MNREYLPSDEMIELLVALTEGGLNAEITSTALIGKELAPRDLNPD
jgi:hypothetical protein